MTDIMEALRQAELKHKNLELKVQFNSNMELFRTKIPRIYTRFKDYEPEELRLLFSEEGYVNLVNFKLDNKPVYDMDPQEFSKLQVANYVKKPNISCVGINDAQESQKRRFVQAKTLFDLCSEARESIARPKNISQSPVGLMIMTGVGLGYHLSELIESMDIYNFCLYDPHPDSFYASLHTIDWTPIIEYFSQPHRRLKFFIGDNETAVLNHIRALANHIGVFNLSVTSIYRHFSSALEEQFIEKYCREFQFNTSGMGFLEDEQISLAHCARNLNKKIQVLNSKQSTQNLPPVIIVGNGPSLDKTLEILKENADNAIIFSCGSTSGTLCKAGIIPDFHIEMERTRGTAPWLKKGTTQDFRDKVTMLALNTVAPETFDLFPQSLMAIKSNDPSIKLIKDESQSKYFVLNFCNPTVTNCGLAFAAALGFREIYLMGVDLGWKEGGDHHAELSLYSNLDEKSLESITPMYEKGSYSIKGNFSENIRTNNVLDDSRSVMELLLRDNEAQVYNLSDGALIGGTTPYAPEKLKLKDLNENKKISTEKLVKERFSDTKTPKITKKTFIRDHLSAFNKLKSVVKLSTKNTNKKEIFIQLNAIYKKVEQLPPEHFMAKLLLRGSINAFFMCIARACLHETEADDTSRNFIRSSIHYNNFIDFSYKLMNEDPLKLDDSESHLE